MTTQPTHLPWTALVLLLAAGGCIYDGDERCSEGETLDEFGACVCRDGYVEVFAEGGESGAGTPQRRTGCEPCGDNEVVVGASCECDSGFIRNSSGACVTAASKQGVSCTDDSGCVNSEDPSDPNTYCHKEGGAADGYCTVGSCAADSDCDVDADWGCRDDGTGTMFCRRPPPGQGPAMCSIAGTRPNPGCTDEAPLCLLAQCVQVMCGSDNDCSPGRSCCEVNSLLPADPGLTIFACLETADCPTN